LGDGAAYTPKKNITPCMADAYFIAFCKRRGKYHGFR
jgi:hypothetical protein